MAWPGPGAVAGATVNAVAGFGEELGWRGFLLNELRHLGFWKSSAVIGSVWGLWHAPFILQGHNYPEHPVAGVFMMIVWCLLLEPILSYVGLKAKSVIAAAIFHGTINGTAGLAVMVIAGGSDLTAGVMGLPGFIVLAALNLFLFAYERFLARSPLCFIFLWLEPIEGFLSMGVSIKFWDKEHVYLQTVIFMWILSRITLYTCKKSKMITR